MLCAALAALGARRWLLAGAALAALADAVENLALLQLDIDAPGAGLAILVVATRTKFVLLGIVSWALAAATWRTESRRMRWLALAHVPALPATIAGCFAPGTSALMTPAIALSWLAAIALAFVRRRPRAR
jgi:hypothetical protein